MPIEAFDFQKSATGMLRHDGAGRSGQAGQRGQGLQRQVLTNQQVGPALLGRRAAGTRNSTSTRGVPAKWRVARALGVKFTAQPF